MSHEAHLPTPRDPADRPYEGSARAWDGEDASRAASLEPQPLDPSVEEYYANPDAEPSPEAEPARNTLEQVQQLWNETDEATRRAIWIAMEDNAAVKRDQANAKPKLERLRNDDKTGKIDKLETKVEKLEEAIKLEEAKNKARKGEASSFRSGHLKDRQERINAKLRFKYGPKEAAINRNVTNRSVNEWIGDEHRQTESYKIFREALQGIDDQAAARVQIRNRLESLSPDDPQRAELQASVDSWGDTPDEVAYAEGRLAAAEQFEENLAAEKKRAREKKWSDQLSTEDEETNLTVQQNVEKYINDEALLSDDSVPQARKDVIQANRLQNGSTEQYLRKLLLDKNIATPEDIDEASAYYREWLKEQDTKKYKKGIDQVTQDVSVRNATIDSYFKAQKIAQQIERGEITDEAEVAANEKVLNTLTKAMKDWPEWNAFDRDTTLNKNVIDTYRDQLVKPFEKQAMANVEQARARRLQKFGY